MVMRATTAHHSMKMTELHLTSSTNLKNTPRKVKDSRMSKERVKQYRLRQKELGRLKREYYVTDSEHITIKAKIKSMRGEDEQSTK